MAPPRSAASPCAPDKICIFWLFCIVFFVIFNSAAGTGIVYDRQTLLNIGLQSTRRLDSSLDLFSELPAEVLLNNGNANAGSSNNKGHSRRYRRYRGTRAGIRNRIRRRASRTPLPSILLANVQSIENKLDDIRARIKYQRDIRDCSVLCFTETWLTPEVPDHAITVDPFSVYRRDRTAESGKLRGGGVCFMINKHWCSPNNVVKISDHCSPDLEFIIIKCRPFYLPRELSSIILIGVYIPPQANVESALSELHDQVNKLQTANVDAAIVVTGDFNKAKLKTVLPNFYQHVTCPTRGDNILDHCYSQFKSGFKSQSLSAFGKSDHSAILLVPVYKQSLKRAPVVTREVKRWSVNSESALQDALDCTDWSVFREGTDNINEYTDTVLDFVGKLVEEIVPTTTVRVFPNQKPWVDRSVREALKARTSAYNRGRATGDMHAYKAARHDVRRVVKQAKGRYRDKVELQFQQADSRAVWQGLRTMTDYKGSPPTVNADVSLANELNTFYARFEAASSNSSLHATAIEGMANVNGDSALRLTEHDVRRTFKRVNTRKATGPDGIPGCVLKVCADQLAPVFTDIFNLSLAQSVIPTCLKKSTIVPVPKTSAPACLNDYRPVALTSIAMKCFEKLVKDYICSSLPPTIDPLQFAYRPSRSTDDAIAHVLHTATSHLDKRQGNYVRMLFIDYSSAFNTIVPSKLIIKLTDLGLNSTLCQWVLDFLTGRPQVVRAGNCISSSVTLNTGAPQGCVLSPLLYSLYTHDCVAKHPTNSIIKFADDTAVVGLISANDETAYLGEVENLALWCRENHLALNVSKTKEIIVDFRRQGARNYSPLSIDGAPVERVNNFKYLGVTISEDLTWTTHIDRVVKKARQRLYFLRRLRKFRLNRKILKNFYSCTIESVMTGNITSWFGNSTAHDRNRLQRVARSAERTIGGVLPTIHDIYTRRCRSKAKRIVKDSSHPSNCLFSLLRSGKRYRSLMAAQRDSGGASIPKPSDCSTQTPHNNCYTV